MEAAAPWLVLQLADSAFPAGGFAHSAGLEAAAQHGEAAGDEGLRAFVADALWQSGHGALPFARAAHRDPARFEALDAAADAFLVNHVANRASRAQGRATLSACARSFDDAAVRDLDARARAARSPRHHAPVWGALLAALGVPLDEASRLLLFVTLRGVVSAAVRLNLVGTFRAQALQRECAPLLDEVLARCASIAPEDVAQTAPRLDLFAATHDALYARLFQS